MNERPMCVYTAAVAAQALLALGQIVLKLLADRLAAAGWHFLNNRETFAHISLLAAAVGIIYAVVMVLWLFVLHNVPVHQAFLFVSLAFFFVPAFSYLLLNESIGSSTMIGTALIVAGIVVGVFF